MSEVRRVTPQEWTTLRSVRLAALRDSPQSFASAYDREASWDEDRWRESIRTHTWFLAWRDGRPVGIAGCALGGPATGASETGGSSGGQREEGSASSDPAGARPAGERWVISMWVDPSVRGSGVADALIGTVAGWARADGARALRLWVADASPRARAFYERAGFHATGGTEQMPGDAGAKCDEFGLDLGA